MADAVTALTTNLPIAAVVGLAVTAALSLTLAVEVPALNQIPNYESLQR